MPTPAEKPSTSPTGVPLPPSPLPGWDWGIWGGFEACGGGWGPRARLGALGWERGGRGFAPLPQRQPGLR